MTRPLIQIRTLTTDDARAYQALRLQALRECPSAFASSYEEECDTPIETIAKRLTATSDRQMIGAFDQSQLVGTVGLQREELRKLAHKAFIWGMFVAPEFRQRGIGRQLIAQAVSAAAEMPGMRQINLGVNAANVAAIALYQAMGFTSFGTERGFLQVDGVLHDEIHMVREL